jgi:replicative DNA helicase
MENSEFKNGNRVQELSQITRYLKNLAREFNVPIIALSQLSRNVDNRVDQKPILSDLRESGSIEQDADVVLMLNRVKSVNSNQNQDQIASITELIIAKQRNGPTGIIKLAFNENQTKFLEFNNK